MTSLEDAGFGDIFLKALVWTLEFIFLLAFALYLTLAIYLFYGFSLFLLINLGFGLMELLWED